MNRPLVDTGHQWIGRMPDTWALVRLGSVFSERKTTVSDEDFEPLSVSMGGVVPRMENVALTANNDARKLVRAGDYVINSRSDRKGSGGLADRDGSVSVISTVLTPRGIEPRFAHHLLRSTAFQEEFYRWGSGIVADLWSTRFPAMSRIMLPSPPLPEQRSIADFLDRETAKIDALIEKQNTMIDLLRERRSAIISHLLDAESLTLAGTKFKHHIASVRQGWSPQCNNWPAEDGQWAVLKAGCANGGRFRPEENKELPEELDPRPDTVVRKGDLIVSRANTRELVGAAAVVHGEHPRLMLSDKLYAFRLRISAIPDFVSFALGTKRYRDLIELEATGASPSMQNITQEVLRSLPLDLPSVEAQREQVEAILRETSKIDALIKKSQQFVELALERRSALITAAVTGQIDVTRKAA